MQSNLLGIAEFVLDLGKPPRVRLQGRAEDAILDSEPLSHYDIAQTYEAVGADNWREDNRAAIDGSLHRMSCVRSARGNVTGITIKLCR